jgi:catechol 2,3-dioxygenase-like lactoylglutathione lyase family enzyme
MEGVRGLHHVALRCADLGRMEEFYRGVLRLDLLCRWPGEGGSDRSIWLSTGRGFLALERASGPADPGGHDDALAGWRVVALEIARLDRRAWEERLAAAGVPVIRRTPFSLFFQDAEGNRVALSHWPEEA